MVRNVNERCLPGSWSPEARLARVDKNTANSATSKDLNMRAAGWLAKRGHLLGMKVCVTVA